jgi:hypothetical protein
MSFSKSCWRLSCCAEARRGDYEPRRLFAGRYT